MISSQAVHHLIQKSASDACQLRWERMIRAPPCSRSCCLRCDCCRFCCERSERCCVVAESRRTSRARTSSAKRRESPPRSGWSSIDLWRKAARMEEAEAFFGTPRMLSAARCCTCDAAHTAVFREAPDLCDLLFEFVFAPLHLAWLRLILCEPQTLVSQPPSLKP